MICAWKKVRQTPLRSYVTDQDNAIENPVSNNMTSTDQIIDDYRKANEDRRVYLWLTHRNLRKDFLDISLSQWKTAQRKHNIEIKKRSFSGFWRSLIARVSLAMIGF